MSDSELKQAKERLMKLWDAYETQERELKTALGRVTDLEERQRDKERVIETLRELAESKDQDLRKLELDRSSSGKEVLDLRGRLEETNRQLELERSRFKKLFVLTQELESDVDRLGKELDERDRWFRDNSALLEQFPSVLGKRLGMVSERPTTLSIAGDIQTSNGPAPASVASATERTTFERIDPEKEAMERLRAIPGVDDTRARTLLSAGYGSMEKLKTVSPFELLKLEGMTPTIARKITEHAKTFS
ncbi:MAG: helix-hairpin-helix domain-containing protein [Candidatus Thermoplasmatota archaeon]|jgi:replicative superfamily II helicase|nr:helix-hairpin-helix domain-containing protein [Candidatus Thermoplasmatota archaeon]